MNEPGLVTSERRQDTHPVFISYASADRKKALSVCKAVERRGTRCWISCRDVAAGDNYQEAIVRALRSAPAMILVFTDAANRSDEIKKELSLASRYRVPVVALRTQDVEPSDAFAYELSTRQWVDAFPSLDKAIDGLTSRLDQLSASGDVLQAEAAKGHTRGLGSISRRTLAIAASVALLVVMVAAGLIWRGGIGGTQQVSLAVLPFADLSAMRDKAYFAEGVAEEILSTLAAEKGIKVLGRTSARQLDRDADPRKLRETFGITHFLEGSTRTSGNSLRVNVRLVDTSDGTRIWEEEYSGALSDVFSVQDNIATAVVRRLRGTFSARVEASETTGINIYQTYLAARALMRDRKEETLTQALGLAKKAIAADPNYAPAHAIYAELLFLLSDEGQSYGHLPIETVGPLAVRHAREAIRLAPEKAEGYAALGLVLRGKEGAEALQRAIKLDPARAELRIWLGVALTSLGRHDEAYPQYLAAAEIEPLWPVAVNRQVQVLASSGQFQQAVEAVNKFRRRGGSQAQAFRFMATIARSQADISKTVAAIRAQIRADPNLPNQPEWLGREYRLLGLSAEALGVLPRENAYDRMLAAGDTDALRRKVVSDGQRAWRDPATDMGMFALGAMRDWAPFLHLYRTRPALYADSCNAVPVIGPTIVLALRNGGQLEEARHLHVCLERRTNMELGMKYAAPAAWPGALEYRKAALLAIAGDRRALDWLSTAVDRGWRGQYFSTRLSDWPAFDPFRNDQRYASIQKRIDAAIARERAEVLAGR